MSTTCISFLDFCELLGRVKPLVFLRIYPNVTCGEQGDCKSLLISSILCLFSILSKGVKGSKYLFCKKLSVCRFLPKVLWFYLSSTYKFCVNLDYLILEFVKLERYGKFLFITWNLSASVACSADEEILVSEN